MAIAHLALQGFIATEKQKQMYARADIIATARIWKIAQITTKIAQAVI